MTWTSNLWWEELKQPLVGRASILRRRSSVIPSNTSGHSHLRIHRILHQRGLHPEVCSAAIIIECLESCDRLTLSVLDVSQSVNAFRGELLGVLAIHLILHSLHATHIDLPGKAQIHSDCTSALRPLFPTLVFPQNGDMQTSSKSFPYMEKSRV